MIESLHHVVYWSCLLQWKFHVLHQCCDTLALKWQSWLSISDSEAVIKTCCSMVQVTDLTTCDLDKRAGWLTCLALLQHIVFDARCGQRCNRPETRAVQYDQMFAVMIENQLSFHVTFIVLQITLLMAIFFIIWTTVCVLPHGSDTGRKSAWRQHKQTWMGVNVTTGKGLQPAKTKWGARS